MKKLFITAILFLLSMSVLTNAQTRRNTEPNRCTVKYYPVANGYTKKYAVHNSGKTEILKIVQRYNAGTSEFTEKASHSSSDTTLERGFRCMPEGIRSLDLAQVMSANTDFKFQTSNDTGLTMPAGNLSVGKTWTTGYDLAGNFNIAAGESRQKSKGSMNAKTTGTANAANQVLAIGEKVTVPGGTFNAAKIKTVMTIQINVLNAELIEKMQGLKLPMGNMKAPPTTMTIMQWYAPGVGLVKSEMSSKFGDGSVEYLGSANAPDADDDEIIAGDDGTKGGKDITPGDDDDDDNNDDGDNSGSGGVVKTNKIRLCSASPEVSLSGVNAQTAQSGIQKAFAELLDSSAIEVVALEARLPILAKREAAEKQCDYVLNVALKQKKGKRGGGGGIFGRILEGATDRAITSTASNIPYGGNVGERIARDAAVRAAYEVAALKIEVNKKDEFTLEYSLVSADSATVLQKASKQKADKDGEDVVTPMIEAAANEVATAILK